MYREAVGCALQIGGLDKCLPHSILCVSNSVGQGRLGWLNKIYKSESQCCVCTLENQRLSMVSGNLAEGELKQSCHKFKLDPCLRSNASLGG
jgi:hypothetical protein